MKKSIWRSSVKSLEVVRKGALFLRAFIYPPHCVCCKCPLSYFREHLCDECFNELNLSFEEAIDDKTLFKETKSAKALINHFEKYPSTRLAKLLASYIVSKCIQSQGEAPFLIFSFKDSSKKFHLNLILKELLKFNQDGLFQTLKIDSACDIEEFYSHSFAATLILLEKVEGTKEIAKVRLEESLEVKIQEVNLLKTLHPLKK